MIEMALVLLAALPALYLLIYAVFDLRRNPQAVALQEEERRNRRFASEQYDREAAARKARNHG